MSRACVQPSAPCAQAVKDGGRVVFCCDSGESRAAAVLIGCLMVIKKCSFDDAAKEVAEASPYIDLNDGFSEQLQLLGRGATDAELRDAAERREDPLQKKGKTSEHSKHRRGARDVKSRARDDD
jgi:hypothetical protein